MRASGGGGRRTFSWRGGISPPRQPIRYLVVCGTLFIAVLGICTVYLVANFRQRELLENERELKNTALIVAEQLDRSFQAVDLVQRSVLESVAAARTMTSTDLTQFLGTNEVHQMLATITIINASGLVNFSRYWSVPAVNVADRFQSHPV